MQIETTETTNQQEDIMITTEAQYTMFDCTVAELDQILEGKDYTEVPRMAMSMVSDIQEMIALGLSAETVRRALNRVKYILDHIPAPRVGITI